jgi:hypothetical protein
MSTRVYPTHRPTEDVFLAFIGDDWTHSTLGDQSRIHGLIDWTFLATTDKTNGGTASNGVAQGINQHATGVGPYDQTVMLKRFVLRPFDVNQTVSGTFDMVLGSLSDVQGVLSNTTNWVIHITVHRYNATWRVWEPVATVLDMHENPTAFPLGFGAFEGVDAPIALTSTNVLAGDRLVVEIGQHVVNPNTPPALGADTRTLRCYAGTTNSSNVALATDAVAGNTNLTTAPGWFEFSDNLTFAAVSAPPAHDACADAKVIPPAGLPYTDGPIDVSESTDTQHAVWYTWTAPDATRVMVATFGSNYWALIDVFAGTCGALGFAIANTSTFRNWLGMSQYTTNSWVPTPGATYLIRVRHLSHQPSQPAPSAGALTVHLFQILTPADDDLYISAQNIVAVRGTQLVTVNDDFYNSTPTGSAFDYTQREMYSVQTGDAPYDTAIRLYVGFFGDWPLVEVLDPALLHDVFNVEVGYFYTPTDDNGLTPGNDSDNISTIVFDRAGRIVMGFYGDTYAYPPDQGHATVPTANVRRMDGLNLDSNPTPPSVAESFEVEQDESGTPSVELSSDQKTIFYTSAGRRILRYDLDTQTQLPDFATVPDTQGHGEGLRWTRLLPPGDGSGGLLVADWLDVKRLNAAGVVIQTYTPADPYRFRDLTKLELNKAGDAFWVSDQLSAAMVKFDLATGTELLSFDFDLAFGQLCGFSVYQGYRAGTEDEPDPPVEPEPETPQHGCPTDFPIDPGGGGGGCPVSFFP